MEAEVAQGHLEHQMAQHAYDVTRGADVWNRPKLDRARHYGLRLSAIVGRMAAAADDESNLRMMGEAYAVALSSANMLGIDLARETANDVPRNDTVPVFLRLADEAGCYADAVEKIDHLEDFFTRMRNANAGIVRALVEAATKMGADLGRLAQAARESEAANAPRGHLTLVDGFRGAAQP